MSDKSWQHQREMTPTQYKRIIKELGMSQAGSGRFLGFSERTARRFISGQAIIPPAAALLLRAMVVHKEVPIVPSWER
jgi:DNA-binding transcriptional regulator YiaG